MDKKKLETFRKKLETRRQELRHMVVRNQQDGRTVDDEATQDVADRAASSYNKEFLFSQSNNDRQLLNMVDGALARIREGSFGNASPAAKKLMPSVLKLCPGRVIASSARKRPRRDCSKPHSSPSSGAIENSTPKPLVVVACSDIAVLPLRLRYKKFTNR